MGTGVSGRYYTSHGSSIVHHQALIHSFDGEYSRNPRTGAIQNIKSGGHGQSALDIMDKNGIAYNIVVFCKPFLEKVAKHFWRLLHLQKGGKCRRSMRTDFFAVGT